VLCDPVFVSEGLAVHPAKRMEARREQRDLVDDKRSNKKDRRAKVSVTVEGDEIGFDGSGVRKNSCFVPGR
jgi:hypothetical protein